MNTYIDGPVLRFIRITTKNDFVQICKNLNDELGLGYECEPEKITEGGIEMVQFPGKTDAMYKSFRIYFRDWPWIYNNAMIEWEGKDDLITRMANEIHGTSLRSFENAPSWTMRELLIFKDIFERHGIVVSKLPNEEDLVYKLPFTNFNELLAFHNS